MSVEIRNTFSNAEFETRCAYFENTNLKKSLTKSKLKQLCEAGAKAESEFPVQDVTDDQENGKLFSVKSGRFKKIC